MRHYSTQLWVNLDDSQQIWQRGVAGKLGSWVMDQRDATQELRDGEPSLKRKTR